MTEDIWSRWLSFRRQGSSTLTPEIEQQLHRLRDRVLDLADIKPGATVMDVGCGDGLIGFGALERVGAAGRVIFCRHLRRPDRPLPPDSGATRRDRPMPVLGLRRGRLA